MTWTVKNVLMPSRLASSPLIISALVATLVVPINAAVPVSASSSQHPDTADQSDSAVFRESFDSVADQLAPRANDPDIPEGTVGFTHAEPAGWSVRNDASMSEVGVEDWRGWAFTTPDYWVAAEDQMRDRFARSHGIIAVADSDEFADLPGDHSFETSLTSPQIDVSHLASVDLGFDSHYRSSAGQEATVTVSFDGGAEKEVLRLDSTTVTEDYDGSVLNARESATVEVPQDAKSVEFTWNFKAEQNSWYWAIDSVSLTETLSAASGERTSAWVASDIQGHPQDFSHALTDFNEVRPNASGLIVAGDIVDSGAAGEWDEIHQVMDERAGILPDELIAAIGNHESYSSDSWEAHENRFLDFAQRDQVWGEYLLDGAGPDVPVLVLGQEEQRPPEVPMSEEQLSWFEERLDYWTEQGSQVLVVTHFPLGDTVSASWIPSYHDHHEHNDRLTEILGEHPNAVLLTGHTHYPAELGDWAMQRRTDGGHPDGFWAINTLAMHVEWDARGESTDSVSEIVTGDINRGLTIDAYDDRLVVTARDFGAVDEHGAENDINEELRSVTIPNTIGHNGSQASGDDDSGQPATSGPGSSTSSSIGSSGSSGGVPGSLMSAIGGIAAAVANLFTSIFR